MPTASTYGTGCSSASGPLVLTADTLPWIGATLPAWRAPLETLRVPLLAICGLRDYLCPPETWDSFLAVPALRRVVLENSAHNPQIEEQARFDELVRAFAREHTPS